MSAVKIEMLPRTTVKAFAEQHGLTLIVKERHPEPGPDRFYARFDHVDLMGDGVLIGTFGNGATVEEAIEDYGRRISRGRIAVNAWSSDQQRRDIVVPVIEAELS